MLKKIFFFAMVISPVIFFVKPNALYGSLSEDQAPPAYLTEEANNFLSSLQKKLKKEFSTGIKNRRKNLDDLRRMEAELTQELKKKPSLLKLPNFSISGETNRFNTTRASFQSLKSQLKTLTDQGLILKELVSFFPFLSSIEEKERASLEKEYQIERVKIEIIFASQKKEYALGNREDFFEEDLSETGKKYLEKHKKAFLNRHKTCKDGLRMCLRASQEEVERLRSSPKLSKKQKRSSREKLLKLKEAIQAYENEREALFDLSPSFVRKTRAFEDKSTVLLEKLQGL